MKSSGVKKNRGQSLVSVIIAAGVGATVLGFLTDMLVQQGISQKFITQKLEINDLTANLITTFSRSDNCTCQFSDNAAINPNSNSADLKFNVAITNGSQSIDFKKLYAGCESGGVMPLLIAEEGLPLPNSSSLRVNKVEFVDLEPTGGEPNEWQGKWRISFQVGSGSAIRSVRPVQVTQKVIVAPNGVNTRITNCKGLSSGSGTQDFLAKWSPTSGVLKNSTVFEDDTTGNIGVGTNNPSSSSKMEVSKSASDSILSIQAGAPGNSAPQSILRFYGEHGDRANGLGGFGTGEGLAIRYNNGGDSFIESFINQTDFPNSGIYFQTNAGGGVTGVDPDPTRDVMAIKSNGRVGIGTTSPVSALEVRYNNGGDLPRGISSTLIDDRIDAALIMGRKARGIPTALEAVQTNDHLLNILSQGFDGTSWLHTSQIISKVDGPVASGSIPTSLDFWAGSSGGGTFRMRISSNGNVGIGTSTPDAKLEVDGDIRPAAQVLGGACSNIGAQGYNAATGAPLYCDNTLRWAAVGSTTSIKRCHPSGYPTIQGLEASSHTGVLCCLYTNGACGGAVNCINCDPSYTLY